LRTTILARMVSADNPASQLLVCRACHGSVVPTAGTTEPGIASHAS